MLAGFSVLVYRGSGNERYPRSARPFWRRSRLPPADRVVKPGETVLYGPNPERRAPARRPFPHVMRISRGAVVGICDEVLTVRHARERVRPVSPRLRTVQLAPAGSGRALPERV